MAKPEVAKDSKSASLVTESAKSFWKPDRAINSTKSFCKNHCKRHVPARQQQPSQQPCTDNGYCDAAMLVCTLVRSANANCVCFQGSGHGYWDVGSVCDRCNDIYRADCSKRCAIINGAVCNGRGTCNSEGKCECTYPACGRICDTEWNGTRYNVPNRPLQRNLSRSARPPACPQRSTIRRLHLLLFLLYKCFVCFESLIIFTTLTLFFLFMRVCDFFIFRPSGV
jgi:hypothetical protein